MPVMDDQARDRETDECEPLANDNLFRVAPRYTTEATADNRSHACARARSADGEQPLAA